MGKKYLKKAIASLMVLALAVPNSLMGAQLVRQVDQSSLEVVSEEGVARTFRKIAPERTINFDKDWKFHWAGDRNHPGLDTPNAYQKEFNDSSWRKLDLPHDWSIEFDFNIQNSIVGSEAGYLDGGTGWYRKAFTLPETMAGKRVSIHFNGVYMDSTVYVNGQQVGRYPNGYTPFTYDITDYLTTDGLTENVIAVKVVNQQPSSRWYSGSGIYRGVELIVTDPVHVTEYGTFITTPNIETEYESGRVTVQAQTEIENESTEAKEVKVRSTVLSYEDNTPVTQPQETEYLTVNAGEIHKASQEIVVEQPKLWSTTSPNLYKMKTEIIVEEQVVDTYETRFGFRWFEFDPNEGFSLNGEWMKLKGVCMHHDQGALGAVANYRAIERQMEIMKDMGTNAIRVTHNPASDELLQACDEKGLLVIDEAFDTWYGGKKQYDYGRFFSQASSSHPDGSATVTWAEFDLKQMVKRGRNFPGIIAWSVGNEVGEANGDTRSMETINNMKKWIEEIDPTRGMTQGADKFRFGNGQGGHENIAAVQDTVGFNYAEGNYDAMHQKHPDWNIYGSETSSATKSRGEYAHPDSKGNHDSGSHPEYQQSSYDNDHVGWGKTATDSWIADRDRKYIAGQFIWTGFDYIGEPTPWHNTGGAGHSKSPKSSYFGIVDTAGFPKDDYYLYQSVWKTLEEDPMIHILPHWNWEDATKRQRVTGTDGKIPIRVYSNAPEIELFVDGVSQGTKAFAQKTTNYGFAYQQQSENSDRLYQEWRLNYTYKPGTEIKAVARNSQGEVVAEESIVTAGDAAQIDLSADRMVINADGYDLSYITVDIQDAAGNLMPTADNEVRFSITGNGKIVGVDNGNPISHERYKSQADGSWKRKAFNGKTLVIVQSTPDAGSFTLTASSTGLTKDSLTVYTKETGAEEGNEVLGYENLTLKTTIGNQPSLPTTIGAVLADGSIVEKAVEWDSIDEQLLQEIGILTVGGTVTETGHRVTLQLMVVGVVGVKNISMVTAVGKVPTLPERIPVVYSDGTEEMETVVWHELDESDFDQIGRVQVEGTVEAIGEPVSCFIRVSDEVSYNVNISTKVGQWPKSTASYNQGPGNNYSDSAIDGDINQRPCWNNWVSPGYGNAEQSWVGIEFENMHTVGKVGMHWYTDGATKLPREAIVEYSTDGTVWAAVSNQSKTNGFFTGSENEISFDPVTIKYIRIAMKGQVDGSKFKPVGIAEFKVYESDGVPSQSNGAKLTQLKVNGVLVEGFNPDIQQYTMELPYGAPIPEITAEVDEADNATVFVIPPMTNHSEAIVQVTAEDGVTKTTYVIQFEEAAPKLKEVSLSVDRINVTEDDIVAIELRSIKEDGQEVEKDKASVQYQIASEDGGVVEIINDEVYVYTAGTVKVAAEVTYEGTTVRSNEITLTISPNEVIKTIVSYDPIKVMSPIGVYPNLPNQIKAYFDKGLPRMVAVTWDEIPENQYNQYKKFIVDGSVEGQTLKPQATVEIKGAIAIEATSVATVIGIPAQLPEKLMVYYSDGTQSERDVVWNESSLDYTETGIFNVSGEIEGVKQAASASIRITDKEEEIQLSENYAKQWTGSQFPAAIASFTNDGVPSNDRIEHINDTIISFGATPHNRWTNWQSNARNTEWVGVLFAEGGKITQRYVDTVNIGFFQDSGTSSPKNFVIEYYVPDEVPGVPSNFAHVTQGDLANEANWRPVTELLPNIQTVDAGKMNSLSFAPINTYAIRFNMTKKDSMKGIAITELEAYGKEAVLHDSYEVTSIRVEGEEILNIFDETLNCEYVVKGETLPVVEVEATNHAGVTIIPATHTNGKAQIKVVPENGDITKTKTYTINFTPEQKGAYTRLSVDQTVVAGRTFEANLALCDFNEKAYAGDVTLQYDEEKFELVEVVALTPTIKVQEQKEPGKVRVLIAMEGGMESGKDLLTFRMMAKQTNETVVGIMTLEQVALGTVEQGQSTIVEIEGTEESLTILPNEESLDKAELSKTIEEAEKLIKDAVVGDKPGQYPKEAKEALEAAILHAKQIFEISENQEEVNAEVINLREAINTFKALVNQAVDEDINQDGVLDIADLALVAYYYQTKIGEENWDKASKMDLDSSGVIDIGDLTLVANKILNK